MPLFLRPLPFLSHLILLLYLDSPLIFVAVFVLLRVCAFARLRVCLFYCSFVCLFVYFILFRSQGKTSLVRRLCDKPFRETYLATLGFDVTVVPYATYQVYYLGLGTIHIEQYSHRA